MTTTSGGAQDCHRFKSMGGGVTVWGVATARQAQGPHVDTCATPLRSFGTTVCTRLPDRYEWVMIRETAVRL